MVGMMESMMVELLADNSASLWDILKVGRLAELKEAVMVGHLVFYVVDVKVDLMVGELVAAKDFLLAEKMVFRGADKMVDYSVALRGN
jgi:hypothetical protein